MDKAERYADMYHEGQERKVTGYPYRVHPQAVVDYLEEFGVYDEKTLAIAWLHDTLEDTNLIYEQIRKDFGKKVADGVYLLTRNVNREKYKERLSKAPKYIRQIKICDTLDNIVGLVGLDAKAKRRKIRDCLNFYIPLAEKLLPKAAEEMKFYLWLNKKWPERPAGY